MQMNEHEEAVVKLAMDRLRGVDTAISYDGCRKAIILMLETTYRHSVLKNLIDYRQINVETCAFHLYNKHVEDFYLINIKIVIKE